jgi:menaquinone-dependent protoporphyrinogen oxidase
MKIAIFYATREGQTHKIAEHVAAQLRLHGDEADVFNLKDLERAPQAFDWSPYDSACVAASVHAGHHEREAVRFAHEHRAELERVGAAFLSVTLSEAGAEDMTQPIDRRQEAAADARRMVDVFIAETGWHPIHTLSVAGALAYSHYNFFVRWIMKRIARKAGAPTDTSRDYEFTDWKTLDAFVAEELVGEKAAQS